MKTLLFMFLVLLLTGNCVLKPKVKEEVKSLQILRADCENLQADLEALGAKKWTKIIDDKAKACKDHGFWQFKRREIKDFTEGL